MNCNCIEEKIKEIKDIIFNHESVAEIVKGPEVREMSFILKIGNWGKICLSTLTPSIDLKRKTVRQ